MQDLLIKVLKSVIILLIPVSIVGGAVRILTSEAYLTLEYGRTGFPPDPYGFSTQERLQLASTDVHYVSGHLPADALSRQLLDGLPVYNPREVLHMEDVRAVFSAVLGTWAISLILLAGLGLLLWRTGQAEAVASAVRTGGLLTSALVVGIALTALLAWQAWFELFHSLFFAAGSWLFSYTDTLIRLFPVEFWSDATLTISALSLGSGLLMALAGWRWQVAIARKVKA